MEPQTNPPLPWTRWVLPALLLVHFLLRWAMTHSPLLAESYYDEAVTGNMALHILKGEPQVFFWGQPYMGALEAYLASSLFLFLGSSAYTLHLTDILICAFLLFIAFQLGTLAAGRAVGLVAAAFWAFSPLYLSVIGLLTTGGHEEACAFGAFVLFGVCRLGFGAPQSPGLLAVLTGLLGGLGYWSSLLSGPYLLAGGLGLALARPRLLLTRVPWVGLIGFLFGSLPFWLWQWNHDFSTFGFFENQGVGIFSQLGYRVYTVLRYSLFQSLLGDWWDGHSVLPKVPTLLAWGVWVVFYLPSFLLTFPIIFRWVRRTLTRHRPFQEPIDLLTGLFWILVIAFSTSEQGASGSLRYTLSFYLPFSIMVAVWLRKITVFQRWFGSGALIVLIGFNLFLHLLFLQEGRNLPYRPVDRLIQTLIDRHIHYAYADIRIAQPLTFESREKIICADYFGQRNFDYLRAVDQAPDGEIAIITHRRLGNPLPEVMEETLQLSGGRYDRFEQGDYVIFHHFQESAARFRSIPAVDWRITASRNAENVFLMRDRDILTDWRIPLRSGEWVQLDLGRVRTLDRVTLLPGAGQAGETCLFRLEISRDGRRWTRTMPDRKFMSGLTWVGGRPRLDQVPRIEMIFPPRAGRFLRLTNLLAPEDPGQTWTIAELFVYEFSTSPAPCAPDAKRALARAGQVLEHWMDEPTGPHPLFPGADQTFRRRRVNWTETIAWAQTAIRLAPDWEEAHRLLEKAVGFGELRSATGRQGKNESIQYDTLFPPENWASIPSAGFKGFSNINNKETGLAVDGDYRTRWGSLKGQKPGMFFQLDLGAIRTVDGFSLFLKDSLNDFPRGLKILVSPDGVAWREIRMTAFAEYAFRQNRLFKKTVYRFPSEMIRQLKLVQTGSDPTFWWSIYELQVGMPKQPGGRTAG